MIVSSSDTPFAKFMKALGDTASDWVRDGHTHYAGAAGGKCPYCQQRLPANFEADIAATFDAQYQQDIRDLMKERPERLSGRFRQMPATLCRRLI